MQPILQTENVEKYYGSRNNLTKALDGISFEVEAGEFVGIMGASGSGKTTLLNCVSTIDTVTSGRILIDGNDITAMNPKRLSKFRRNELGFIFQDFNLLDTLTAYENIALALTILKRPPGEIDARVKEVAAILGISEVLPKYPYQMSGGQRQRVAGARAIVTNPSLVLADEPTGALDSKSARALMESLGRLVRERGATILIVTHDAFSASYCDRIMFIRDGRLFNQLVRGAETRKEFFDKIIEVVSLLGGDVHDIC
jgi:putative ABC transport system ATP-binding protein